MNGGANVNATTDNVETALHQAASRGHNQTVDALLNGGADVNATNNRGLTALHIATQNGHNQTVRGLKKFTNETHISQSIEAIISAMDRENPNISNQNNNAIEALTVVLNNRHNGSDSIDARLRERRTNNQNSIRNNPNLRR